MSNAANARASVRFSAPWKLHGLSWCSRPNDFRLAVSSFIGDEYKNKLQVVRADTNVHTGQLSLVCQAQIDHPYPPTKVMWAPKSFWQHQQSSKGDLIATSADYLRLWNVQDDEIALRAVVSNKRNVDTCAPVTSFDWCENEPNIIGTSSIDTTCTIWDLNDTSSPKQQIIAHDQEVYDIAFSLDSNLFGSVGGDGSLRLFDLRALESSTILYESPGLSPLLRMAWNRHDNNLIAAIVANSSTVVVVDIRNSSVALELRHHSGLVNSISWSNSMPHQLCSAGEDGQVLLGDVFACSQVPMAGNHGIQFPPNAMPPSMPQQTSSSTSQGAGIGSKNSAKMPSNVLFQSQHPLDQVRWSPDETNCVAIVEETNLHVVQL